VGDNGEEVTEDA
jgi:hypothetical protein